MFRDKFIIKKDFGNEIDDAVLTVSEKDAAQIEWPLQKKWVTIFTWFSLFVFMLLAVRIVYLNVVQGDYYQGVAKKNSIRSINIPAPRGMVYDRFGKLLVGNVPSIDLVLIPADIPKNRDDVHVMIENLQKIVQLSPAEQELIISKIPDRSLSPVSIKEKLTQEQALLFLSRNRDFPGMSLVNSAMRHYPDGLIFSHIIGYEGKIRKEELADHPNYLLTDSIGKQGIEKWHESELHGINGKHQVEVDSKGNIQKDLGNIPPQSGSDLILNIDADLQKKAFEVLRAQLEKSELKKGAIVALDPQTGGVLALVSYPSFDNNLFAKGIGVSEYQTLIQDPDKPLFNRAVSGEYPPGSTIKPVVAGAALSEGVVAENTEIESRGGIQVGSFFFGDWKAHGFTDVRRAIAVSSDVFFYSVGGGYGAIRGMGMEVMKRYEALFGFGEKTGIDLTGEADGFLPTPDWKKEKIGERWYIGDDYHASIGQGFVLSTPIQIVNAISAIANGGTLYKPHIVSQIKDSSGKVRDVAPEVVRDYILDAHILQIAREGMRETVTDGTATALKELSVEAAGKTGTAQFGGEDKTHGWFVSFAPYDKPTIAMIVLTEDQDENGYNAVPITKEIYQWYFENRQ